MFGTCLMRGSKKFLPGLGSYCHRFFVVNVIHGGPYGPPSRSEGSNCFSREVRTRISKENKAACDF